MTVTRIACMITFTGMARGTVLSCPGPSDSGTGRPDSDSLARCRVPAAAAAALPRDLNLIPSPTASTLAGTDVQVTSSQGRRVNLVKFPGKVMVTLLKPG